MSDLAGNLATVQRRIVAACERAGRDPDGVTLIAVTKTVTSAEVEALYDLGVRDFGENRVAEGGERLAVLEDSTARRHLIGHLQRNKAAVALAGGFTIIHSVESEKLLDVLEHECEKRGTSVDILLEVNVSGEASKYGVAPEELPALARAAKEKTRLCFSGLMTMAPLDADPEAARPFFRELRLLRNRVQDELGLNIPHLSMGMTGDFETAIEEGATMIRIGTALFR